MNQLHLNGTPWSEGWATCRQPGVVQTWGIPLSHKRCATAVLCRIGGLEVEMLLDTGASLSLIPSSLVASLEKPPEPYGHSGPLERDGDDLSGPWCDLDFEVLADVGNNLALTAPFVISDFPVPVLGVRGFLDRVRIAFQPPVSAEMQNVRFYFGR